MMRTVLIFAKARADIERIFHWLEQRSPSGAVAWYEALLDSMGRIAENPESYPMIAEALPRSNRRFYQTLFKTPRGRRYRTVFEWTATEIRILRVLGPGQRPLRGRDLPKE